MPRASKHDEDATEAERVNGDDNPVESGIVDADEAAKE